MQQGQPAGGDGEGRIDMGHENSKVEDPVLYTADGEKIGKIGKIQCLPGVPVPSGKRAASALRHVIAGFRGTLTARSEKNWRCRSRKRFIKLLMSKGISRKYAEKVARVARIAGVSYRELWQSCFFWVKPMKTGLINADGS